jgi:hypothetical protein
MGGCEKEKKSPLFPPYEGGKQIGEKQRYKFFTITLSPFVRGE